jgi:hypothetical protein
MLQPAWPAWLPACQPTHGAICTLVCFLALVSELMERLHSVGSANGYQEGLQDKQMEICGLWQHLTFDKWRHKGGRAAATPWKAFGLQINRSRGFSALWCSTRFDHCRTSTQGASRGSWTSCAEPSTDGTVSRW